VKRGDERRRFFDALADTWDLKVPVEEIHSALGEMLLPWKDLFAGAAVLDAGCGTGQLAAWLALLPHPPRLLAALDLSPAMMERFTARVPTAAPILARVPDFPFKESSFDFVLAMGLFPHLEDKEGFLDRCRGILAPGGWILVFHCGPRERINRTHRKAGPPVEKDILPRAPKVVELLLEKGFLPGPWRDDGLGWLVSGKKKS